MLSNLYLERRLADMLLLFFLPFFAFLGDDFVDLQSLRDEGGDDFEEPLVGAEVALVLEDFVDGDGADGAAFGADGDADEGGAGGGGAGAGAVEEAFIGGDVGDDDRFAGGDDGAGDAFADVVGAAVDFLGGEADGGFGAELAGGIVEEDQGAAFHAEAFGEDAHGLFKDGVEIEGRSEHAADFVE